MITYEAIRKLATQHGDPAMTTVYLDVDGRHRPRRADYEAAFERLADELRHRADAIPDSRVRRAVDEDIVRMRTAVVADVDRSHTRGVALFSSSERNFFAAVPLPRAVRDEVGLATAPHIAQLVGVLKAQERVLIVLVDRQRVRLLRLEFGDIEEHDAVFEPAPRAVDTSIELGSWEHHREEAARGHFRRAADEVRRTLDAWPADRLIVGGPDDAVTALEKHLPPAVATKLIGRMDVRVTAPLDEIADRGREVEMLAEHRRRATAVEQLRQRAAQGRGAVVGLDATLEALGEQRVATLFVHEGFTALGARCPSCGHVGVDVHQCPRCGTTNIEIDDVVEVAIEAAVAQGADVEFCDDEELEQFGSIGAFERW